MADYTMATGTRGFMTIRDNGTTISFLLSIPGDTFTSDIPWAYTINGVTAWSTFDPPNGGSDPNVVYTLFSQAVSYAQTVGFLLGDTNSSEIGGPTNFYQYINRGAGGQGVTLQVGDTLKKAIPYVNVNGVWKVAEPWSAFAGLWKQTN